MFKRARSAISGRFVPLTKADTSPRTTVVERVGAYTDNRDGDWTAREAQRLIDDVAQELRRALREVGLNNLVTEGVIEDVESYLLVRLGVVNASS